MKKKQSFKREMEKKQKGLFLIGLMGALSFTLMAFEWTTFDANYLAQYNEPEALELEEIIEVTKIEPKKSRVIPPIVKLEDLTKIEVIDDPTPDPEDKPDIDPKPTDIVDPNMKDLDDLPDLGDGDGPILPKLPEAPFVVVEHMPEFPGGEANMYKYLSKNIRHTECSRQSGITQTLYVQFVVEKDGSISNVSIPRKLGCGLDEMASRVVNKMPKWKPGEQRGKKVRVKYTLPIKFALN